MLAEQKKIDALIPQIDAKISEVSKALASLDQAARRTGADTSVQVQKTLEDVADLRGQLELAQHRVQVLEDGMKQLTDSTQQRLLSMESEKAQRDAEAQKRAEALKRPTDKKGYLALAEEKVKAKDLPLARTLYNEFLRKWPKDPLAARAHFELAETYYGEKKCREALFEYSKVIQDFPKFKDAPEAYLHSGRCFAQLDMDKEAKLALDELVRSYPRSAEAKQARRDLAKLAPKATKRHKK
jgi:tol-pal system protein YbgF